MPLARLRTAETGQDAGLISTAYHNQMQIWLMKDGSVKVSRHSDREVTENGKKAVRSQLDSFVGNVKLRPGRWTKIAVVYDLRTVTLFVNGVMAGSMSSPPSRSAEWINHVIIGAKYSGIWNPSAHFKGDIRSVRMYGRNLDPSEFL